MDEGQQLYTPVDKNEERETNALNGILRGIDPDRHTPDEMLRPSAFPFGRLFERVNGKLVQTYPREDYDDKGK